MSALWIEKYKPNSMESLVLDPHVREIINNIITKKEIPNLIITGNSGLGKTSTISCVAKILFGPYYKDGVLELNVSDGRGIKIVDSAVDFFCKKQLDIDEADKNKYAKHKLILLDEADNMTKKTKQLVNDLMNKYGENTRFAFTCNNSSEIAENIQSKSIILRYSKIPPQQISQKLTKICELEKVHYTESGINSITTIVNGDLRQAINRLQTIHNVYSEINEKNVYKLCDIPHPTIIENIFLQCHHKNFKEALILFDDLKKNGYSNSDISINMLHILKNMKNLDEHVKINFLKKVTITCINISKGINSLLQMSGLIASLCLLE